MRVYFIQHLSESDKCLIEKYELLGASSYVTDFRVSVRVFFNLQTY